LIRPSTSARDVHQIASRAHRPDLTNVTSVILGTLLVAEDDALNAMTATVTNVIHQHSAAHLANQDSLWTVQHQNASERRRLRLRGRREGTTTPSPSAAKKVYFKKGRQ